MGGNDAEQRWKARDPVIVVHAIASGVREMSRPCLHVGVDIRTSRQQPDCRGEESRPSDRTWADEVDVWLDNRGSAEQLVMGVDALWGDRLVPFEANLRTGRRAPRQQQAVLEPKH